MMTSAQVVAGNVNVIVNSPSKDYTHLDDRTLPTYDNIDSWVQTIYSVTVYFTAFFLWFVHDKPLKLSQASDSKFGCPVVRPLASEHVGFTLWVVT